MYIEFMNNLLLGKKIKKLREFAELTQKQLGEFLGFSEAHISHIESGNRTLGIDELKKLANQFHVSLDTLAGSSNSVIFRSDKVSDEKVFIGDDIINDFINHARKQ